MSLCFLYNAIDDSGESGVLMAWSDLPLFAKPFSIHLNPRQPAELYLFIIQFFIILIMFSFIILIIFSFSLL